MKNENNNKTLRNTMLGFAAAGAIGAGVYFATNSPETETEIIDDIKPFYVPVYKVDTWKFEPLAKTYSVKSFAPENIEVEKAEIAKLSPEDIGINIASVERLSPEKYKIMTAFIEKYSIDSLSPKKIKVLKQIVETADIEKLSPEQIEILFTSIESFNCDVERMITLQKLLTKIITDKRLLQYDKELTIYNDALLDWIEIYSKPLPEPVEYIPLLQQVKMIAELRSLDHAAKNLVFYKKQGYTSCLITFNGTESKSELYARINVVRAAGLDAWLAWSGPESLHWSIYCDINKVRQLINYAAPLCTGYLPAWRRTSAHLVEQDEKYIEHLTNLVRQANPAIYIIGESYYGQTWKNEPFTNQSNWTALDNIVRNQSGILIAGISTQGFAIESALNTVFAKWKNVQRLGLVLGETPYYASTNNKKRSFKNNLKIKKNLEKRFIQAGCVGTITIHGDGSDRGLSLQATDDIGKYEIVY